VNPRLAALLIAAPLSWFLLGYASGVWSDYWLLKDGREGMATVTHPLWTGHNAVAYRYTVEGKEYSGKSGRNYQDPRYMYVQTGEKSVVYYSASHPWLSSLRRPEVPSQGWPVVLLVVLLAIRAVITIITPQSRWALNFNRRGNIN
jgi:hypothetical protein